MRIRDHLAIAMIAGGAAAGAALPSPGQEFEIPQPIQTEHEELHERMESAVQAGGQTGEAARAVMDVLAPHFEKEEEHALPQLGLLARLTGAPLAPEARELMPEEREELIARTERLRAELPEMLEEHRAIEAALEDLRQAAEAEGQAEHARLAEEIRLHAQTEEQLLYPAALLVGDHARLTAGPAR